MTTFAGLNSAQQAFASAPESKSGVIIPNDSNALEPETRDTIQIALLSTAGYHTENQRGRIQEDL
jgi:hypothetical protein